MRLSPFGALTAVLLFVPCVVSAAAACGADPLPANWSVIEIPGPIEGLREAVGILTPVDRTRVVLEIARLVYSAPEGRDPNNERVRGRLLAHLAAGLSSRSSIRVPLPLAPGIWWREILRSAAFRANLGAAILSSPRASLIYHGLFGLDDETLAYLSDTRNGALASCVENARTFAAFGRSLEIHDGRVVVPGGDAAVPLWEHVVGAGIGEPKAFIRNLLSRDNGWLAQFYDTIAELDPPHMALALGLPIGPGAQPGAPYLGSGVAARPTLAERLDRFKVLLRASSHIDPRWVPAERPFMRPDIDLGLLLRELRVTPNGMLQRPTSRRFWDAVFPGPRFSWNDEAERPDPSGEVDAAYLAEHVLVPTFEARRERLELLLFAQRLCGSADLGDGLVLPAVDAMRRFRALALTLERIGIRDPATFAASAGMAERAERSGDREASTLVMAQFQASLAIIDRLVVHHSLSTSRASALVSSLVSLSSADGRYGARLAGWFGDQLLPALPQPTRPKIGGTGPSPDDVLLDALAGPPGAAGSPEPIIAWEGERYRIDLGAADLARMRRVRPRVGGNSLEAALALSRRAALSIGPAGGQAALQAALRELAPFHDLWQPVSVAGTTPLTPDDLRRAAAAPLAPDRLTAASSQLSRAAETARRLARIADAVLADTLASLVYTMNIADADSTLVAAASFVRTHDFNRDVSPPALFRVRGAWSVPTEVVGVGTTWHLAGSLLALDVALATTRLQRMSSEPPRAPPTLHASDRLTLALTVSALDGYDLPDAERDALASALARGRERVAMLTRPDTATSKAAALLAAEAHMSGWRANGLRWAMVEEPQAVGGWFSLGEVLRLGRPDLPAGRLDAWGMSPYLLGGSLALRFPVLAPWDEVTGRAARSLLVTRLPDLNLRLAEWLSELRLPAALLPGVAARAAQDLADEAQPSDADDAVTFVRQAQAITREHVEDYVAALTAEGPLVPAGPTAGRLAPPTIDYPFGSHCSRGLAQGRRPSTGDY